VGGPEQGGSKGQTSGVKISNGSVARDHQEIGRTIKISKLMVSQPIDIFWSTQWEFTDHSAMWQLEGMQQCAWNKLLIYRSISGQNC